MLELPVRISSAPGEGSTFSVLVPRVAAVAGLPAAVPVPPPRLPVASESFVLCIDNEARVREAMVALLGGWGCRVATAATHAEALACVAEAGRLPDLVLADLHLDEGPDGLEIVDLLRRAGAAPCRPRDHRRPRPHVARPCPCPSGRVAVQAGQARRPRALLRMRERTLGLTA